MAAGPFLFPMPFDYVEEERRPSLRALMRLWWTDTNPGQQFFKCLNALVVGAYFEKLRSKSFAVYSIAITDANNNTCFVKNRGCICLPALYPARVVSSRSLGNCKCGRATRSVGYYECLL